MEFKQMDSAPSTLSGGIAKYVHFVPASDILTSGLPVDTNLAPTKGIVADMAALALLTGMVNTDTAYVTAEKDTYEYVLATTEWKRASPVVNNQSFTFAAGKGFIKVLISQDKFASEFEVPTEDDVTGKELKPVIAVPGHDEFRLEFERLLTTNPGVFLIESGDGELFQYGTASNPATTKVKEMTEGQKSMDWKGILYQLTASQPSKIHYKGGIELMS
jgi:hypothetical protein